MADKKKKSDGVIAIITILILCALFPRSIWVYIVCFVSCIWVFRALSTTDTKKSIPPDFPKEAKEAKPELVQALPLAAEVVHHSPPSAPPASPQPARTVASLPPRRLVDNDISVPVPVRTPAAPKSFAIPPVLANNTHGRWIPPGESIVIAGSLIDGGMIYVGGDLKTLSGTTDPCLINPELPIASRTNVSEREFGYWPAYSQISPTARRTYLSWLAGGRSDPAADIGYVFLFFYGLERRAIIDSKTDERVQVERPAIAKELRRLLTIYGEKSYSFKRYASEFLSWLEVAEYSKKLYNEPVPELPATFEVPIYIRLALGLAAVDGVPVPGHLALAWARLNPTSNLRTAAIRCYEQFNKLFLVRYAEKFKPGIVLPCNRTKLKLIYQPASSGFQGANEISLGFGETPDVTALTRPQKQLKKVVDDVTEELDQYSRYLGRNPEAPHALEGLLLLPPEVWPETAAGILKELQSQVSADMVVMTLQELLDMFQAKAVLNKERALTLARILESVHIGLEPDILAGARTPKSEDHIVLFASFDPEGVQVRTPAYQAATLTLQLASVVASADGEFSVHEMNHLREQVQAWPHVTQAQSTRLLAQLRLLLAEPVSLTSLKKKLEPLDVKSKEAIAVFMATVAQADGSVTPAELKMLEKVYKTLGLDSKKVFSDVHAVAAGTTASANTVEKMAVQGFQLDSTKIAALQRESHRVSELLADIFKEEAPTPALPLVEDTAGTPQGSDTPSPGLLGLDESQSALARMLLSRPHWKREELLDVAADLELMLDGALEHINEMSFDTLGIPFTEGDNPIDVNPEILEKLEA